MAEQKTENYAETAVKVVGTLAEKTIVPVYEDLAKPSLEQIGEGLGGFLEMVMMPLQMMGYQAEYWKNEFKKSLERKASKIAEENLVPPNPIIAGPIIQALGYTVHEEPLREMFTSLLATAMSNQTKYSAHPAFVDIIKQMNSDEARILKFFASEFRFMSPHAVVDIRFVYSNSSKYHELFKNESFIPEDAGCENYHLGAEYLENLERLKLVEISKDSSFINGEEVYKRHEEWLQKSNISNSLERRGIDSMQGIVKLIKRKLNVTSFGRQFLIACI